MNPSKRSYHLACAHHTRFSNRCLVECLVCSKAALVEWAWQATKNFKSFRCTHCGHTRDGKLEGVWLTPKERLRLSGAARDPVFDLKLWLQANYRGQILWAYNWEHLVNLEELVRADLRTGSPSGYRTIESQVPKWLLLAKNREGLLRALRQMRARRR